MRIEDVILVSDLDGTIVPISGRISEKNIKAVKRFKQLGGVFTVATGRSPESAYEYLNLLSVDGIIIANNGATLYDVKNRKTVWSKCLEPSYKAIVRNVLKDFPQAAVQIITDDSRCYFANRNSLTESYENISGIQSEYITEEQYPSNCCKVLFALDRDDKIVSDFIDYTSSQSYDGAVLVQSGAAYFELMCEGLSKGSAFERLVQAYGKSIDNSAAIGDFYNDVEMIKKAAIGAAVSNAVDEVKESADTIVKSCEDDGLADFIDYLLTKVI